MAAGAGAVLGLVDLDRLLELRPQIAKGPEKGAITPTRMVSACAAPANRQAATGTARSRLRMDVMMSSQVAGYPAPGKHDGSCCLVDS